MIHFIETNGLEIFLISIICYSSDVTNSNFISCASALHDIGLCQIRLSQLDKAEKMFTESLRIAQSLSPEEHQGLQLSSSKTCQQVSLCDDVLISIVLSKFSQTSAWTSSDAEVL